MSTELSPFGFSAFLFYFSFLIKKRWVVITERIERSCKFLKEPAIGKTESLYWEKEDFPNEVTFGASDSIFPSFPAQWERRLSNPRHFLFTRFFGYNYD